MPRGRKKAVEVIEKAETVAEAPLKASNERKRITVRATRIGYYADQRRFPIGHGHPRSGEPFEIFEDQFSDSAKRIAPGLNGWMERVDEEAPKAKGKTWASQLPDAPKKDQSLRTNPPASVI